MKVPGKGTRTLITGQTGSGKTQAGIFLLSLEDWPERAWIIIDFKRDGGLQDIPGINEIPLNANLTALKPGLHIIRPQIWESEGVEALLWRIWDAENLGLFIDEGFMIDRNSKAMLALLTQGRSKDITIITLTQRPVGVTRFVISESSYFQIFKLIDRRDRKLLQEMVPVDEDDFVNIEKYGSIWYDVNDEVKKRLAPVPDMVNIYEIFAARMPEPEQKRRQL